MEISKLARGAQSPPVSFSLFVNLTVEFGPWDAQHSRFELNGHGNAEVAPVTPLFCYHEL
jgi:hypothetical protein